MNKSTKVALTTVAVILIAAGLAMLGYVAVSTSLDAARAEESTGIQHDDIEYKYDEDGNLTSEVYYKDNEYNGQKDYYTSEDGKTLYEMEYNADGEEIASTVTKSNVVGSIVSIQHRKLGDITDITEYDYYDDLTTLKKKTVKTYEGEDEIAVKSYYAEDGHITQECEYLNGELTKETFFDEESNTVENGAQGDEE